MTAYDYDKQCWVEGPEATDVERRNLTQELEVVNGPNGEAYCRSIGTTLLTHRLMLEVLLDRLNRPAPPPEPRYQHVPIPRDAWC